MANWSLGLLKQPDLEGPRSQRERRYREVSSHLVPVFLWRHFLVLKLGMAEAMKLNKKQIKSRVNFFLEISFMVLRK